LVAAATPHHSPARARLDGIRINLKKEREEEEEEEEERGGRRR